MRAKVMLLLHSFQSQRVIHCFALCLFTPPPSLHLNLIGKNPGFAAGAFVCGRTKPAIVAHHANVAHRAGSFHTERLDDGTLVFRAGTGWYFADEPEIAAIGTAVKRDAGGHKNPGVFVLQKVYAELFGLLRRAEVHHRVHINTLEALPLAGAVVVAAFEHVNERAGAGGGVLRRKRECQLDFAFAGHAQEAGRNRKALPQFRVFRNGFYFRILFNDNGLSVWFSVGERIAAIAGVQDFRAGHRVRQFDGVGSEKGALTARHDRQRHEAVVFDAAARAIFHICAPGFVGLVAHREFQGAAGEEVFVEEKGLAVSFAVELKRLNIRRLRAAVFDDDAEGLAFSYVYFGIFHPRRPDDVGGAARRKRVKSERAENVPGRHLAAVFVARQALRRIGVLGAHDFLHALLRFPGLPAEIVQIGDVVAGFVAVRVLPDQPGDVGLVAAGGFGIGGKNGVQVLRGFPVAAH